MIGRAVARGELPPGTGNEGVIEFLVAPAYMRLLLTGGSLDPAFRRDCVRRTLAAFGPGV